MGEALYARLMQGLQNPSAYDSDAVRASYEHLVGGIDDSYALQRQGVDEEMARRGIYDSTIAGGRMHDLNIGQRDARTQLAGGLIRDQAASHDAGRSNAVNQGMQYGRDQYGNQLTTAQFNAQQEAANTQLLMQLLGIT